MVRTRIRPRREDEVPASSRRAPAALGLIAVLAATWLTFRPVVDHRFLNWDDGRVVAENAQLTQSLGALVPWAFTTRTMHHYQPLSWLALAAVAGTPASPIRVHTVALAVHVVNALLLFCLIAVVVDGLATDGRRRWIALAGTALFALHPLRVEPVAWASALPYLLSMAPLLGALLAWVAWLRDERRAWLGASVGLFAVSQLFRVTAPLLPVVLVLVAAAQVVPGVRPRSWRELALAMLPYAAVALPLAAFEAAARQVEALGDIGLGPRLAWSVVNPVLYLWRTVVPVGLTPLDALPRAPRVDWLRVVAALAASVVIVVATWRLWSGRAAVAVWGTWLLLLAPIAGLFPSGLQVTADRYTYVPTAALAVALAAALATLRPSLQGLAAGAALAAALGLAPLSRAQTAHWRDSQSLWTRALALDADNDVARYNLALVHADAGRHDAAAAELEELVRRVPDHALGLERLQRLRADAAQRDGDAAAAAGRLNDAVALYSRALELDPVRQRARLTRGMARVQVGDLAAGAADLEASGAAASDDPAVAGALALAWSSQGREGDAIALLRRVHERQPRDWNVTLNLARLLATAEPASLRDPRAALALAGPINDATGGRDPRVLDIVALALAAAGERDEAHRAWTVAIARAEAAGDPALAAELRRHQRQPRP